MFIRFYRHSLDRIANALTLLRSRGPDQLQFWIIALFIGAAAGLATVLFMRAIQYLQFLLYGGHEVYMASAASLLAWYWILIIPIIGGLIVGYILSRFTPDARARGVSHVIVGAALNDGRVEGRSGLGSALASLVTLSMGGSTGREGPVVHLGAVISSKVSRLINADGITGRDLMGCAAAAAVSASFNAPIAGTLFALEVVLRHYAIHAFAPIVIASVVGAVISRSMLGDLTEFILPEISLQFYSELPAFLLLGLLCGLVAVAMVKTIFIAENFGDLVQRKLNIPNMLRPAIAGAGLGTLAIFFPHIIGVGYETTWNALNGNLLFWTAVIYTIVKIIAVALTFAGRMGGGVFSPSLMVGALTGIAFGWVATSVFSLNSYVILYALAGMAGVSAAVLGAPISTALIIFEMTGDWQTGIAVMVTVSLSSAIANKLIHRSFFMTQLERAGIHIAAGPQAYLLSTFRVTRLLKDIPSDNHVMQQNCQTMVEAGIAAMGSATLEDVMPLFSKTEYGYIPVVSIQSVEKNANVISVLYEIDALRIFNNALVENAREEHS